MMVTLFVVIAKFCHSDVKFYLSQSLSSRFNLKTFTYPDENLSLEKSEKCQKFWCIKSTQLRVRLDFSWKIAKRHFLTVFFK